MVAFIDAHRAENGVEPICARLPIAPSTYYELKARAADPARRSRRACRDEQLCLVIQRIWAENFRVYGALNTRPRKTLGWRTPAEVLDEVLRSAKQNRVATTG